MNYVESNFPNKEKLREHILALYDRDIAQASVHFSSRNYAFCLSDGCFPVAIRVGLGRQKTRAAVMSELMFVDYIKANAATVSEPILSNNNNIVEETDIDGQHYCITMFRKANGDVLPQKYWNDAYYERIGRVLGEIHKASHEAAELGFRFKRPKWNEMLPESFEIFQETIGKAACDVCDKLVQKIKELPETPEVFGVVHGDFTTRNIFSEWDNVWVFDFDDCCYGYYMMDVASMVCSLQEDPLVNARFTYKEDVTHPEGMFAHFRKGYEQAHSLPEEHWAMLNDFCVLRCAVSIALVSTIDGISDEIKGYLPLIAEHVMHGDDIFAYMDSIEPRQLKATQ